MGTYRTFFDLGSILRPHNHDICYGRIRHITTCFYLSAVLLAIAFVPMPQG